MQKRERDCAEICYSILFLHGCCGEWVCRRGCRSGQCIKEQPQKVNGEILNTIIHFGNPSLWLTLIPLGTVTSCDWALQSKQHMLAHAHHHKVHLHPALCYYVQKCSGELFLSRRKQKKSQPACEACMNRKQPRAHPAAELFSFHVIHQCLK